MPELACGWLSPTNSLEVANGRRDGGIDCHDEILKKSSSPQDTGYGDSWRETRHGLELFGVDEDLDLVVVERRLRSADNSLQVAGDSVFDTLDSQRVTQTRVEETRMRTRIHQAFDQLRRG